MVVRIRGTRGEVAAMAEYLPTLFPVVERIRIVKDRSGSLYRLYANVWPTGERRAS